MGCQCVGKEHGSVRKDRRRKKCRRREGGEGRKGERDQKYRKVID